MKTPIAPTLEDDAKEVEMSYANPARYDDRKLFPQSTWEFTKWDRQDALGFLGCCALVGFILIFFKAVLLIGG
jgi:energy-coupling factor transporter transmembrane protein EcfT